jgi:16S rRNA (uracil1498-N3)-methyltransferase
MTRRRWIADRWDEATAQIEGAQATHLVRVLRAEPGREYDVVAGGHVWHSVVASVSPEVVRFNLIAEVAADPALPVTLVLSVFKFDRMEWVIEKATELGVARICPAISRRTEKHLAQGAEKRVERWRRLAHEAAQQSRRSDVPVIGEAGLLKNVIANNNSSVQLVLAEQERTTTLRHAICEQLDKAVEEAPDFSLAIGPEGGWTPEEEALFDSSGWQAVSLGPRILRAETAAISALSILASHLE